MTITVPILPVDTPTINNRIYTTEAVEQALQKVKEPVFGGFVNDYEGIDIAIENYAFRASNLRIHDGNVIAEIEILNTPKGLVLEDLLNSVCPMRFAAAGTCRIENQQITEYEIRTVQLVAEGVFEEGN